MVYGRNSQPVTSLSSTPEMLTTLLQFPQSKNQRPWTSGEECEGSEVDSVDSDPSVVAVSLCLLIFDPMLEMTTEPAT
jgi:hypothetical protein